MSSRWASKQRNTRRKFTTIPTKHSGRRGRHPFCPTDGISMVWNPDLQRFFCPLCQFGVEVDADEAPFATNIITTADGQSTGGKVSNSMKFRPVKRIQDDDNRRFANRRKPYANDPDLQALVDSGATIVATYEHQST